MKKETATSIRLKEALAEANISQQELADKSGLPKASISQYINGHYVPSNESAGKMAEVLKVNPAWLMGFNVSKSPVIIDIDKLSFNGKQRLLEYYEYLTSGFKKEDDTQ